MERIKWLVLVVLAIGGQLPGSESGFVAPRRILPVAWTVGVLLAASVLFGGPTASVAEECQYGYHALPNCTAQDCSWNCFFTWGYCTSSFCYTNNTCQCWND